MDGRDLGSLQLAAGWHEYALALPAPIAAARAVTLELRSPTFAPRDYDRASPDGRRLGVMAGWAELAPATP
jgi:hypothetical protein